MFAPLVGVLGSDAVMLVDDLRYSERERTENVRSIIQALEKENRPYQRLSAAIRDNKFPVLLSTGLSFLEVRTLRSLLKYAYAMTIGALLEVTGLAEILHSQTGRRFSAGGLKAEKFERKQPEKLAASYVVRYPKGLDISRKYYPEARWAGVFDLHLCHGEIDSKLIRAKFPDERCIKIGYPKYAGENSDQQSVLDVHREFGIGNDGKPLILWMPTHLKQPEETGRNILPWISPLAGLLDSFHVLVRIHPKSLTTMPELLSLLQEQGFLTDTVKTRNLQSLYAAADLVLADFGASVLSAIYMEKNLLLLDFDPLPESVRKIQHAGYLDLEVGQVLPVINDASQIRDFNTRINREHTVNTLDIRHEFFGESREILGIKDVAILLQEKRDEICPTDLS